jgi:hypothetical protein
VTIRYLRWENDDAITHDQLHTHDVTVADYIIAHDEKKFTLMCVQEMWHEEQLCNLSVLQRVHPYNLFSL